MTGISQPVLALRGLRRNYGRIEAVAGIDLEVGAGERLALLGPNGAGKSTTLALMLGLLAPSSGEVRVLGRSAHRAIADGLVGALLQSGARSGLPPGTRVGELIRFVASLYRRALSPVVVRGENTLSGGGGVRYVWSVHVRGSPVQDRRTKG